MSRCLRILLSLAPAAALTAQSTPSPEPLVCIRGFEREVLDAAAAMFGDQPHTWQLPKGTQGEVRLAADGRLELTETTATIPTNTLVQIDLRVHAWMRQSSTALEQLEKTWGPRLMLLGTGVGLPRELARELQPGLRSILQDLDRCTLTLARSTPQGAELTLTMSPTVGSASHAWLQNLRPGGRGRITLSVPDVFAHVAFDLKGETLPALCAPFAPFITSLTAGTSPEALADQLTAIGCLDGLGALAIDAEGLQLALGLRDSTRYAEAAFAKSTLTRQQEHLAKQRVDMEYTVDALVHRDVKVMKSAALPATPTPWLATKDGEVLGYLAVAGRFALSTAGGAHGEARIRALIDAALDHALQAATQEPTAPDVPLASAQIDLLRLEGAVPESMRTRLQGEKLAGVLQLELHATASSWTLKARIR